MSNKEKDNVFYVCTLIEYIARVTSNRRSDIIKFFDKKSLKRQLKLAEVNHCLTFEEVAGELIEEYNIPDGEFNTIKECRYTVPSVTSIGRVYQQLVLSICKKDEIEEAIMDVFSSFISDEISDFNSNVFYSNPDYIKCSFLEGELLA